MTKPLIHLILERPDGHRSEAVVQGTTVTSDMLDSAEDLFHTLMKGERPVIKNLYDLVAWAFNTTRENAKERITAAAYGMSAQKIAQQNRIPLQGVMSAQKIAQQNRIPMQDALVAELARDVSGHDRRRIADGDRALALLEPKNDVEIRAQLEIIHNGMLALQSLDDLGEEGNRRANDNFRELERRYDALKARLESAKKTR